MLSFARRPIILLSVVALTVASCGGSTDGFSEAQSKSSTNTALSPATTVAPSSTTTTPTTIPPTTTATKSDACPPDLHAIRISTDAYGEDVEPGSYRVPWAPPDFVFTVSDPTKVWILYDYVGFEIQPIPYPEWQTLRMAPFLGEFELMISYDGETEIEPPDDLTAWVTGHPLLDTSDPQSIVIDGYEGVQVDAKVLESHPGFGSSMQFGDRHGLKKDATVRIIFFEVEGHTLWWILHSTEEGFADAIAWSDEIIAGFDFC